MVAKNILRASEAPRSRRAKPDPWCRWRRMFCCYQIGFGTSSSDTCSERCSSPAVLVACVGIPVEEFRTSVQGVTAAHLLSGEGGMRLEHT